MKNIIAKSKTTDLIIQVTYMDSHITRGFVLVGDTFNKVGSVDYWSTSTLDMKNIIAKHKDTPLIIQVNYIDDEIIKGKVLVKDYFYPIGYEATWSTKYFNISNNETKQDPIVKQVVDSFQQRSKVGIEKYGTTLEENNTDDFLEHLQQELMDATLYIEKLKSIKPSLNDFSENEIVEYLRNNGYKVKYKL